MKEVKFKKFKDQVDTTIYIIKKNFDFADKSYKRNFFNVKNKYIKIETLVPNDQFDLKNIFYYIFGVEKYLFLHITDKTNVARRNEASKFIMKIKYEYDDIKNCESGTIAIDKNEEINVYAFNDNSILDCNTARQELVNLLNSKINLDKKKEDFIPKEAGDGGVIVVGP